MAKKEDPKIRFHRKYKVNQETGCWEWTGAKIKGGYGAFNARINGRLYSAHRFSYWLYYGDFDQNLHVCHKCDTPSCVNPEHLFLGTNLDNRRDCQKKGRFKNVKQLRGEKNSNAKYTNKFILQIRYEYAVNKLTNAAICRKYNLKNQVVSLIINRIRWSHI
jgi:hypothetical protein